MVQREEDFENLLRVRITEARHEAIDVRRFELESEDGSPLPEFHAGAHVDLLVHLPDRSRALRSYSIASPPSEKPQRYTVAILYEEDGTGGSMFLHEKVRAGYNIDISAPKNYFELAENVESSILIAGGIGITPILAMAHELSAAEQPFDLHYASKTVEHMAFRKTIEEAFADQATLYFDDGDPAKGINVAGVLGAPEPGRHVYVCGPKGLIDAARDTAETLGWDELNVHFEVFTPPEPMAGDTALEVVAAKSGITVQVPKDMTILDALEEAGVEADSDCRMGICGTCAVKILEGEAAHRDNVLLRGEHADGMICTCVSRANTPRLVLDI